MHMSEIINDLKRDWKHDLKAGFLVALVALPLSLGIASASGFPPMMGVWTAIVGGLLVSFFMGVELAIKGPAAGLVVIFSSCVDSFGGGFVGWQIASLAVAMSGLLQFTMGKLKWASFLDFYPTSALRGLLASIGVILFARQAHLLLGIAPSELKGKKIAELLAQIPDSILHAEPSIAAIGVISLIVAFAWSASRFAARVPSALVAIGVGILIAAFTQPWLNAPQSLPMLDAGKLDLNFNQGIFQLDGALFSKLGYYLFMLLAVSTIELLLINKAIQLLDPQKRKIHQNKDMVATGLGNVLSGLTGGLAMLSEIARSTASISYGAKTRWANFFHAVFLLLFVLFFAGSLSAIPVAALSALLLQIAYTLLAPKQIVALWTIGKEQFVVFLSTLVACVVVDLFVGCLVGLAVKLLFSAIRGVTWRDYFKVDFRLHNHPNQTEIHFSSSLVFTNGHSLQKMLASVPKNQPVLINLSDCKVVDYASLNALNNFKEDLESVGISVRLEGLHHHISDSKHPLSSKWKKKAA
jgi:MFS superfamily sulfate permease-like transporter